MFEVARATPAGDGGRFVEGSANFPRSPMTGADERRKDFTGQNSAG